MMIESYTTLNSLLSPKDFETANKFCKENLMEMCIRDRILANNGYRTMVIVGGDGSLNDAINGIMLSDAEDKENIALGMIPNGDVYKRQALGVCPHPQALPIHTVMMRPRICSSLMRRCIL